jgi:hypothetical protein
MYNSLVLAKVIDEKCWRPGEDVEVEERVNGQNGLQSSVCFPASGRREYNLDFSLEKN